MTRCRLSLILRTIAGNNLPPLNPLYTSGQRKQENSQYDTQSTSTRDSPRHYNIHGPFSIPNAWQQRLRSTHVVLILGFTYLLTRSAPLVSNLGDLFQPSDSPIGATGTLRCLPLSAGNTSPSPPSSKPLHSHLLFGLNLYPGYLTLCSSRSWSAKR